MENWALIGPSDESPTFPFLSQCFLEYEVGYQPKQNIATETLPLLTPLSMKPIRGHLILSQFFIFSTQRCALFLLTLLFIGSTQLSCLTTAEKESPRKRLASLLQRAGYLPFFSTRLYLLFANLMTTQGLGSFAEVPGQTID